MSCVDNASFRFLVASCRQGNDTLHLGNMVGTHTATSHNRGPLEKSTVPIYESTARVRMGVVIGTKTLRHGQGHVRPQHPLALWLLTR